jgi:hypothetical protein
LTRGLFIGLRLKVKAALKKLPPREQLRFTRLKGIVGAIDGDLGAHIATLEQSGYLKSKRILLGKNRTHACASPRRAAEPSMGIALICATLRDFARHSWTGIGEGPHLDISDISAFG